MYCSSILSEPMYLQTYGIVLKRDRGTSLSCSLGYPSGRSLLQVKSDGISFGTGLSPGHEPGALFKAKTKVMLPRIDLKHVE